MKTAMAFLRAARIAPGSKTRRWLCEMGGAKISRTAYIAPMVTFRHGVMLGERARVLEYSFLEGVRVGDDTVIERGAIIRGTSERTVAIGRECYIGPGSYLDGSGGLILGNSVQIVGVGTSIWTHSTVKKALAGAPLNSSALREESPVRIGNRVWIGGNVTVYPGVEIGKEAVVLPHSVVTSDVSSRTMVGGVPASVKRKIEISDDTIQWH